MTIVDTRTGEITDSATELAALASDPGSLDRYADPGAYIVLACERAKRWLASALDSASIEQIVEWKSQAAAISVYTAQKNLGHDAELSAQEIVRRAERGIGLAIRRGQEAGEITTKGNRANYGGAVPRQSREATLSSPSEVLRTGEDRSLTYAVTDGVTDDEFDEAIEKAKAEKNLSRANVVRKIRNDPPPENGRPAVLHRTRRLDSNRIVGQAVESARHLDVLLDEVTYSDLDRSLLPEWVSSLSESIKALRSLKSNLEKELSQ